MTRHGDLRFYEAAAQVIPLIFIALALEMRVIHPEDRRQTRDPTFQVLVSIVVIVLLTGG